MRSSTLQNVDNFIVMASKWRSVEATAVITSGCVVSAIRYKHSCADREGRGMEAHSQAHPALQ